MSKMIPNSEAELPFLHVETFCEPARDEPGGDLFDTFALDEDKIALVVGNTAGQGPASLYNTAEVRNVLRACLRECPYPARALSLLNDYLCDAMCLDECAGAGGITLSLAVVDPVWAECTFAVAGAEPPLLLHAGGDVEIVEGAGPVIGAVPGFAYKTVSRPLRLGDTVLLATDAIVSEREVCLLAAHRQ
jgi:serine phosphatase RsbU (regulator of sigma subunit)